MSQTGADGPLGEIKTASRSQMHGSRWRGNGGGKKSGARGNQNGNVFLEDADETRVWQTLNHVKSNPQPPILNAEKFSAEVPQDETNRTLRTHSSSLCKGGCSKGLNVLSIDRPLRPSHLPSSLYFCTRNKCSVLDVITRFYGELFVCSSAPFCVPGRSDILIERA